MKFHLLLLLILGQRIIFAQNSSTTYLDTEKSLKQIFSKVSPTKYPDLVPFFENQKWGFIDRKNKTVLIPAIFPYNSSPALFHPDLNVYFNNHWCIIKKSGEIIVEKEIDEQQNITDEIKEPEIDDKVRSSIDGFKGFTISKDGELLTYSDLYQYTKNGCSECNIQLFKYNKQYYAIVANLKGKYGIIDSLGNPIKGFEFNFTKILLNRNANDTSEIWFFVSKNNQQFSLINTKGEVKFNNEIRSYPLNSNDIFGITSLTNNDSCGLFDQYNMQWIVKPQTNYKIIDLYYSSKMLLNINNPFQRNEANIYYLVMEKGNKYFIDINGNKYMPKKQ